MTHFSKGDYVMRKVNVCGNVDIWYGHVLFWGNSRNGRLLIVVEGPEFTFVSDPSHLEKVNVKISSVIPGESQLNSG